MPRARAVDMIWGFHEIIPPGEEDAWILRCLRAKAIIRMNDAGYDAIRIQIALEEFDQDCREGPPILHATNIGDTKAMERLIDFANMWGIPWA